MTNKEINKAVARKLGKPTENVLAHQWTHGHRTMGARDNGTERCADGCDNDVPAPYSIPDYCTDIAAAWELVELMQATYERVEIFCWRNSAPWSCAIRGQEGWIAFQEADTAPMAIALCFLKLDKEKVCE